MTMMNKEQYQQQWTKCDHKQSFMLFTSHAMLQYPMSLNFSIEKQRKYISIKLLRLFHMFLQFFLLNTYPIIKLGFNIIIIIIFLSRIFSVPNHFFIKELNDLHEKLFRRSQQITCSNFEVTYPCNVLFFQFLFLTIFHSSE